MYKLLVNSPSGEQRIEYVDSTGSYYDQSKVIWDERQQGEMPPVVLGKMQLIGNDLVTLGEYLPAHAAVIYANSIPQEVPIAPACEALLNAGLYDAIDTYIATLSPTEKIWWARADKIHRQFPLVESVRIELGLTNEQIDGLFLAAEQIRKQRAGEV